MCSYILVMFIRYCFVYVHTLHRKTVFPYTSQSNLKNSANKLHIFPCKITPIMTALKNCNAKTAFPSIYVEIGTASMR